MQQYLNLILTRLQLCHTELIPVTPGTFDLKKAFKLFPVGQPAWDNWPFCMALAGEATYTYPSSGSVDIRRNITITIVAGPENADTSDSSGNSALYQAAADLEYRFIEYYLDHPKLHTAALSELVYIEYCLPFASRPVVIPPRSGGPIQSYAGVDITLHTLVQHTITNSRITGGF